MIDSAVPGSAQSAVPSDTDALTKLIDANEQLVAVKDMDTWMYVHVNDSMARLLGRPALQAVGLADVDVFEAESASALRLAELAAVSQQGPSKSEHRFLLDGKRRDFTIWRVALRREDGSRTRWQLSLWTETTHIRQQEAQLRAALAQIEEQQMAHLELRDELSDQELRDEATGLYGHGHFQDQLRRELDLSTREHREFSLVSIAVDPPDERLQAAGEIGRKLVLETLGRLLRHNTRAMDASCRLDEEHFVVLLSGVGLATAHSRMDGLRRQCAGQVVVNEGRDLGFTISMGISSFPHTSMDQDELIFAADKALIQALAKGNYVSLASITLE
jgi:diguanylate cyclase (GGDEF)-like protein